VLWQQRLASGLSGNALVDADGNIFMAGTGRVTQLGPDGASEYSVRAEFSTALAAALLSDGSRALLTREGALWAWSARGGPRFQLNLEAGRSFTRASLLPLPNGGALASIGSWLFEVDSEGTLQGYARLAEEAVASYVDAGSIWLVGEGGTLWSWDGRGAPLERGRLSGSVSAAARGAPGHLIAVVAGRELVEWTPRAGQGAALASLPEPGPWPRIAVSPLPRISVLGRGGAVVSVETDQPPQSSNPERVGPVPAPPHPGELLTSAQGDLAWLAPGTPLMLQRAGHTATLEAVTCAQPASLVPAGAQRILASCKSGQIWLIGQASADSGARPDSAPNRAPETAPR